MMLTVLLLMGMQRVPCHAVNGELKNCGPIVRSEYRVPIAAACDMNGDHLGGCTAKDCWCWHEETPAPEPLDVPAIQHRDTRFFYCGQGGPRCDHGEHFDKPDRPTMCQAGSGLAKHCGTTTHATCADKTRILEHDEQNPPLYWCRRVQTGGKP